MLKTLKIIGPDKFFFHRPHHALCFGITLWVIEAGKDLLNTNETDSSDRFYTVRDSTGEIHKDCDLVESDRAMFPPGYNGVYEKDKGYDLQGVSGGTYDDGTFTCRVEQLKIYDE